MGVIRRLYPLRWYLYTICHGVDKILTASHGTLDLGLGRWKFPTLFYSIQWQGRPIVSFQCLSFLAVVERKRFNSWNVWRQKTRKQAFRTFNIHEETWPLQIQQSWILDRLKEWLKIISYFHLLFNFQASSSTNRCFVCFELSNFAKMI